MIDVNGQFPSSDDLVFGAAKRSVTTKAGDLVCPDHKKKATLTITGRSLKDMSVNINACCDKFHGVVSKRIRG